MDHERAGHARSRSCTLLNCVSCHTLERIVKSQYDADGFVPLLPRMGGYANQSTPLHPQRRLAERLLEERGDALRGAGSERAEYLSTINLSEGAHLGLSAQDPAAPDRPRDQGHHHRVRPAARRPSSRTT